MRTEWEGNQYRTGLENDTVSLQSWRNYVIRKINAEHVEKKEQECFRSMHLKNISKIICVSSIQSITETGVLKSPPMVEKFSFPSFNSVNFCFMYFAVLTSSTYTFIIVMIS